MATAGGIAGQTTRDHGFHSCFGVARRRCWPPAKASARGSCGPRSGVSRRSRPLAFRNGLSERRRRRDRTSGSCGVAVPISPALITRLRSPVRRTATRNEPLILLVAEGALVAHGAASCVGQREHTGPGPRAPGVVRARPAAVLVFDRDPFGRSPRSHGHSPRVLAALTTIVIAGRIGRAAARPLGQRFANGSDDPRTLGVCGRSSEHLGDRLPVDVWWAKRTGRGSVLRCGGSRPSCRSRSPRRRSHRSDARWSCTRASPALGYRVAGARWVRDARRRADRCRRWVVAARAALLAVNPQGGPGDRKRAGRRATSSPRVLSRGRCGGSDERGTANACRS